MADDGTTDVGGDGATTILGGTVKEVALSVPVGLMLCGAVLVGRTTAAVSAPLVAEAEPETEREASEAVVMAEREPDAVTPDSEAVPGEVTRPVADAVADLEPEVVPEVGEPVAGTLSETATEVLTPLSDAVPEVAESVAGAEPDAVPEVGTPVSEAEPEVAGPVADTVPGLTEADDEPLTLVTGMTGITSELDVTGITEDEFDVSGSGTTEVGIGEEMPALDAAEDSSEETPDAVDDTAVGKSEGSSEDTAETDGIELCPVPRNEEAAPLESTLGTITTGIEEYVEDPVLVETGTPAVPVEVPRIVSRPTVIPDEVTNGVAVAVKLDGADEAEEVMAGMTIEGRIPVDD